MEIGEKGQNALFDRLLICKICQKSFKRSSNLSQHTKIHDENVLKKYKCNICEYKTWRRGELKKHSITHMEQKPDKYFCNTCQFKTWNKGELNRHNIVHSTETPYTCNFCNKQIKSKQKLASHEKQVHRMGKK